MTELSKRGSKRRQMQDPAFNFAWEKIDEPIEIVTKIETTHNGRQVPMSLPKVNWLSRADETIKRLDGRR